jgi:hypothetical protein
MAGDEMNAVRREVKQREREERAARMVDAYRKLVTLAEELNEVREQARRIASELAGDEQCSWDMGHIMEYLDLAKINFYYFCIKLIGRICQVLERSRRSNDADA